jgi:hypothetical protein
MITKQQKRDDIVFFSLLVAVWTGNKMKSNEKLCLNKKWGVEDRGWQVFNNKFMEEKEEYTLLCFRGGKELIFVFSK